jgi:GntR family transcriptional regulator/MocR family aminotransferase
VLIPLRLVRDQPLQQQIFEQLQDLIVSGRVQPGSRMPSSRMMAEQFAISRMTALLVYERLIAEGYLETRPAAGTFVARFQARSAAGPSVDATALSLVHLPANSPPANSPSANSPSANSEMADEPQSR